MCQNEIVLKADPSYKIRLLEFNLHGSTSLHMHYHRSEYWVILKGSAKVDLQDGSYLEPQIVRSGEVVVIEKGQKHRIENIGKVGLLVAEIQLGEVIDEGDIVRFD
jgi:mannose-1-phosphate guanylyltransferase/mannose-6-phosphate isomerase